MSRRDLPGAGEEKGDLGGSPCDAAIDEPAVRTALEVTLVPWASERGLEVPESALAGLARYAALLLDENQRMNLTACRDAGELVRRHLCDSLQFALALRREGGWPSSLIDLGSGGGMPGLPLAILMEGCRVTLVESIRKKASFLERAVGALGLGTVEVVCGRAEELGRDRRRRGRFEACTARACAALAVVCEYGLPLLARDGLLLTPKGPSAPAEIEAAKKALGLLGGDLGGVDGYRLPGADVEFHMIRVVKKRPTPDTYPRAAAVIARRAL